MPANKEALLALNDWMKQVISLSSAAIVLVTTLLDKLGSAHNFRLAVKLAIISFVMSTITGLVAILFSLTRAHDTEDDLAQQPTFVFTMTIVFASPVLLILGLLFLVIFVCNNF